MNTAPSTAKPQTTLVLQGGGALGSYQAGVYAAMAAGGMLPEWVAGISIGAINGAIIAGNPPGRRVENLRRFWEEITQPTALWPAAPAHLAGPQKLAAATAAALFGQPGFFRPRSPLDWLAPQKPTSYYDTTALRRTLESLVDFDRINAREVRLSVGAVNLRTGRLTWFDTARHRLHAGHIMASGALPPGFPPVEIEGELYWDGGVVSNTPLQYVVDDEPRESRLCFQVDLFHANGLPPGNLEEVAEREKDIRYASRSITGADAVGRIQQLRQAVFRLHQMLPDEFKNTQEAVELEALSCDRTLDIVHLIYRPLTPQGATKDYEFSRATMSARWAQGEADAAETLRAAPWKTPHHGVRIHDVAHERLVRGAAQR